MTTKPSGGDGRRLREYKLATYPLVEEYRIGLIDFKTLTQKMRAAYVAVYGGDALRKKEKK